MNRLYTEIFAKQDPTQVEGLSRFFKTGKGQYAEGDKFWVSKCLVSKNM